MRIPLSAPDVTETERTAVLGVLDRQSLSLGPELAGFEAEMAAYHGVAHAVALNSGTSGLHLALLALGLKEGDEVITASFSFVASANAILYVGARPVFVDVDPATLNIDAAKIEAAITPRTRAILAVHIFGRPAPMEAILSLATRHGLDVVEDACEAIGAETLGQKVGSLGRAGVFGFYPNKTITTGEGGVVVTDDAELARSVARRRNQGRDAHSDWFEHVELGYNYRLPELSCALGRAQLARIEDIVARRARVAAGYQERLADHPGLLLPDPRCAEGRLSWFVYVIRLAPPRGREERDRVLVELQARGIGCGRYFAPIHLQPFYRERFGHRPGDLPETEAAGDRALALPFFNRLSASQQDEVRDALLEILESL